MILSNPRVTFFTPGRQLPHGDSYIIADQCYVQYRPPSIKNQNPPPLPILFVHGGGLTGAQWESTPDLRPGWACLASQLGYEVYILDTVDSGRSPRAPDSFRNQAIVEHRTAKETWDRFRFGPLDGWEERNLFAESQFPVEYFDALVASQIARRRSNDEVEAKGIVDAIKIIGECWIIAHSHGAALILDIISEVKDHVKKMALIEPGGTSAAHKLIKDVPGCVLWGDYLDMHAIWPKISKPFDESPAEIIRLPDRGIRGNTHFPTCDKNSDDIFNIVRKWLEKT